MRKTLLTAAALVASASAFAALGSSPAQAANTDWCSFTQSAMSANCAFSTLAQCNASISGQGGFCERNLTGVRNAQARFAVPAPSASAIASYMDESYRLAR